jgi:hypothetical protein
VEAEHARKGEHSSDAVLPQFLARVDGLVRRPRCWDHWQIFPWESDKADPFASARPDSTEWYFLAPLHPEVASSHVGFIEGELLGLLGFAVLVLGWVSLPFWGTSKQGFDRTHLVKGVAFALLAYLVTFSLLGYYR